MLNKTSVLIIHCCDFFCYTGIIYLISCYLYINLPFILNSTQYISYIYTWLQWDIRCPLLWGGSSRSYIWVCAWYLQKGALRTRATNRGAGLSCAKRRVGEPCLAPRVCTFLTLRFHRFTSLTSPLRFEPSLLGAFVSLCLAFSCQSHFPDSNQSTMQFYPTAAARPPQLVDYSYSSPAAAAAVNQRMNWPHPAAWPYDYSAYSAAAYPPGTSAEVRSPSAYQMPSPTLSPHPQQPSSTDQNGATRHNIADILGGESHNLQSEIAKTGGSGYQKSPTTTTAHNMFSPTTATPELVRSPTTPTHPHSGMIYHPSAGEVPPNYYIPAALPRAFPGRYLT